MDGEALLIPGFCYNRLVNFNCYLWVTQDELTQILGGWELQDYHTKNTGNTGNTDWEDINTGWNIDSQDNGNSSLPWGPGE